MVKKKGAMAVATPADPLRVKRLASAGTNSADWEEF
jgi:hypothetical protein